jgi:hypothetical protein
MDGAAAASLAGAAGAASFFAVVTPALPLSTLVQESGITQMNADKTVDSNFFIISPQLLERVSIQSQHYIVEQIPGVSQQKKSTFLGHR